MTEFTVTVDAETVVPVTAVKLAHLAELPGRVGPSCGGRGGPLLAYLI